MKAESEFRVTALSGPQGIAMEIPAGTLELKLPDGTSAERAGEIADYLNLVIREVSFKAIEHVQTDAEDMELDTERLNAEQPVSEAVQHV